MNKSCNLLHTESSTEQTTIELESAAAQNDTNSYLRWSDSETKKLIDLYRKNFTKLNDRKYKRKHIYSEMAKHFLLRFNSDHIEAKIKNLKKTYKMILDNSKKTGSGKITWPYFDAMQEILGNNPENNPISIASNREGFEPQIPLENLDIESDTEVSTQKRPKLSHKDQSEPGPSDNTINVMKRQSKDKAPEWVANFKAELSRQHKEKMEKQQEFLDLFKQWISKAKD
ncbi:unnamed protein product [Callosobruchus maculatus]|uniref:Myb/SANT-like DNA-binding domain-containing protein n=1 Tax=Callosobruchus maculatus TaxID=64391 RepID=A0A653DX65_CALMS|nr:unnamed protein product [Callosobruchus maculatus]